jgi:hypothetical protein
VRTRILVGVGAWLVGAGAATSGSLLAVSLLGQGFAGSGSQQLSVSAVNRALASEAAEAPPPPSASPAASPALPHRPHRRPRHVHHRQHPSSSPTPSPPSGTVLTSPGGTVVADCRAGGAYLESWSPQQGYEADDVVRGPAATARAVFTTGRKSVMMTVTCSGGTPSATTHTGGWDSAGDD